MNIFHEFLKITIVAFLIFIFNFSLIDKAYAIETPNNNNTYLNDQLKQILNFVAPDNRGINYFILPDSSDLNKIPADPQNILTPEKIRLGQLLQYQIPHFKIVQIYNFALIMM
jgi:cytochrome c peroxidase